MSNDFCGNSNSNRSGRNILRNNGISADNRIVPDFNRTDNYRPRINNNIVADLRIFFRLSFAVARISSHADGNILIRDTASSDLYRPDAEIYSH